MSKGLFKTCDKIEGIVGSAKFKSGEYLDEILNPYAVSSTVCSRCHTRVHLSIFWKKSQSQQERFLVGLSRIMDEGQGILPGKPTPNSTNIPYQTVEIMGLRKNIIRWQSHGFIGDVCLSWLGGKLCLPAKKILRSGFSVGHYQLVVLLAIGSLITDHNDMVIWPRWTREGYCQVCHGVGQP